MSEAVEKPDKMRAEKRPLNLATKKRKLTLFTKAVSGEKRGLSGSVGGEKRGRASEGRWLG